MSDMNKIRKLAQELTDEDIDLLLIEKNRLNKSMNENVDTDTKKKREVIETRGDMDQVEELMTFINPKLKRSIDIFKQQPPTRK